MKSNRLLSKEYSVQSLSHVWIYVTPWTARSMPGLPVHHQLPESTHLQWVSDAIQPSHPRSSTSSPALNFPQHQVLFKWVSSSHQVAKVLEFQLQHQSFQWTPRTDSFRMDWLDLLAVQRTLKNLLQYCSSKAPIFWCSAFFIVQLSHPYMYYSLNTLGGKKWPFFFSIAETVICAITWWLWK